MSTHFHDVKVTAADGGEFSAYLAAPQTPNGAVLVVLQEIFGVNPGIRDIAEDFAAEGYVAIAPDLFWRQEPGVQLDPSREADRAKAMHLNTNLDQRRAVADAAAALEAARAYASPTASGFAVGYCLGGKLAYLMAARGVVQGAVSYYGVGIQAALDEVPNIKGRILLHVAENDALCPPEAQQKIRAAVSAMGPQGIVLTYPGVGHAFARRNGAAFNADATTRANIATQAFLTAALAE
jgi:carboxymethylenebutenolidase